MRKEMITIFIILVFVILLNILTQNYTKKSVDIVVEGMERIKELVDNDQYENVELESEIHKVEDKWNERREVLSYYIEHDEIEKIELELTAVGANAAADDNENLRENLERCIFLLEHVRRKEKFGLSTIL